MNAFIAILQQHGPTIAAKVAESAAKTLIEELAIRLAPTEQASSERVADRPAHHEAHAKVSLLHHLSAEHPLDVSFLCDRTELSAHIIQALLFELELSGEAQKVNGGKWVKVA